MSSDAPAIEIKDIDDLAALIDEVRRSQLPRILRQGGEDVAVLMPTAGVDRSERQSGKERPAAAVDVARSQAGIRAAAGSWLDIDTDALREDLRRQRAVVTRPHVDL